MRNVIRILTVTAVLAMLASVASAQPPVAGTYKSTLGDMLEGRQSTGWNGVGGHADPAIGHVLNGASWDGANLGTEWRIVCPTVANVTVILDIGVQKIVQIDYVGGYIWLDGAGPWGGGDPDYTGIIDSYTEIRTMQLLGGYGTAENHNVSAHLAGYSSDCVAFGIGNGAWFGDGAGPPAGYPAFLDANCDPAGPDGRWGSIDDITMTVTGCSVGVEKETWGAIKQRYSE